MHWTRAKNILIFLLLALNIFLAVNLYIYSSDRGSSGEAAANAQEILSSRNIKINCKVPQIAGNAKRLNFINDGYDKMKLVDKLIKIPISQGSGINKGDIFKNGGKTLEIRSAISFSYTDEDPGASVDISKISKMEKYAVSFLKDKGLMPKFYLMDSYASNTDNSTTFLFIEKYNGFLIYDNYLEVCVTPAGITKITGSRRSIKKAEAVRQERIMTAWQILLRNFTDKKGTVITGIDFGYKENSNSENNMKASLEEPVWRIKTRESNDPRFFNAFNGEEIKDNIN